MQRLTDDEKKTIQAAAYTLAARGEEDLSNRLMEIVRPVSHRTHEAAGRTAGTAVRGAMDRGATHIRRLVRPGGSGLWLAEFETRPGCPPVVL